MRCDALAVAIAYISVLAAAWEEMQIKLAGRDTISLN
jgi:hypothetical protein